jgi:hypothetical protein
MAFKEKLQEFALIAEIIASIAIVTSLIFVGIQIQQSSEETALNTRAVEVSSYQQLITSLDAFTIRIMDNPSLNLLINSDPSRGELTPEVNQEIAAFFFNMTRHADLAFYQYELGMLTEERMESSIAPLNNRVCLNLFKNFWSRNSYNFSLSFRNFINEKVDKC